MEGLHFHPQSLTQEVYVMAVESVCFTSLMRCVEGVWLFHSHSISLRLRKLLCPLKPLAGINQSSDYRASRSFRPRNSKIELQLVDQMLLLQNFYSWCFFSLGQDLICVAMEHYCQWQKVIFLIFLENKLQRFQLFFKKLFSFILMWQKSFACILMPTVVIAVFNECKMIRKIILCCRLPFDDRGEEVLKLEQWSHAHICWSRIPTHLVYIRQLGAWSQSQARAADSHPTNPLFKQQGEDSTRLLQSVVAGSSSMYLSYWQDISG